MNVKDKICVITGGSSGIGLCIVKKLLSNGVKSLVLFELDNENSKKVFADLKKDYNDRVDFYPTDVSITDQLKGSFDKFFEKFKKLDILINNAGIINENAPERMIDINYKAVVTSSLAMINRMGKHKGGDGGVIVNISSIFGLLNTVLPIYSGTKHAIVSFTRTMKESYETTNVRVVAICPGVTDTRLLENVPKGLDFVESEERLNQATRQSPTNVADAVLQIIEEGKSGDVWVSERDCPPFPVETEGDYKFTG